MRHVIAGLHLALALSLGSALDAQAADWPPLELAASEAKLELPNGWHLQEVAGVATTPAGNLLVFHRGLHQLLEFDGAGVFVRELGAGLFDNPHGLRVDLAGNIWTTDLGTHLVLKMNAEGQVRLVLGKIRTSGKGWFDNDYDLPLFDGPNDVAFDQEGNIYVADRGNSRIVKFDPSGRLILTWGEEGTDLGQFKHPHAVVVDAQNRIYVADRENRRIQLFDTTGLSLGAWTHVGYPYGLTLSDQGVLWVTDARAERVLQLNLDGQVIGAFGSSGSRIGEFGFVHSLAVTDAGELLTAEVRNWRVQQFVEPQR